MDIRRRRSGTWYFDRSPQTVYWTAIEQRNFKEGAGELLVGPTPKGDLRVELPGDDYKYAKVGEPICVVFREGAFGVQWYSARFCTP